jgi:hypothetical protein
MSSFFRIVVISVVGALLHTGFLVSPRAAWCEERPKDPASGVAGSFFNMPVPEENYYFIKSVLMVFGNKFGPQPSTEKEKEDVVWDQLLLSFEAFRRNIIVTQEEVDAEIGKLLGAEGVTFDRKKDNAAYEKWLKERVNEPATLFENQVRHLIQIQKLKEEIMRGIDVPVADSEAFQAFLNENSSLDVELVQYDLEKDAGAFYNKVRSDSKAWDKEKEKRPGDFKRPGGVTVQFLLDFWKIPSSAQHEMVGMKPGQFHKPEPIYKGWGVFKMLGSKKADQSAWNAKTKEHYAEKIKAANRYEGYNEWFKQVKKEADIKIYKVMENAGIADNKEEQKKEGKR